MHADESPGHGGVAGQEEGLALLQEAGEPVADRVRAEVRPVVANADHYDCWLVRSCKRQGMLVTRRTEFSDLLKDMN